MENFNAPRHAFGIRFITIARQWQKAVADELHKSGLTDATWAPLVRLDESGDGITQTELALRVSLDTSSLVRLVDLLENRGLIERCISKEDRRARHIYITPAGRAEVALIRMRIKEVEDKLLADVSDTEIERWLGSLATLEARLHKEKRI